MDRHWRWETEHCATVCACGSVAIGFVLCASARNRRESGLDAASGRAIHADAILWGSEDARMAGPSRLRGQCEACAPAPAANGIGSDLRETEAVGFGARASDLSVSATRAANCKAQSSMGNRHHLYPHAARVCVFGGDYGLVQPLRSVLGAVDHAGRNFLRGGTGMGVENRTSRDFQFGSGVSIHERAVHRPASGMRRCDQHGWPRPSHGQHLCGTPLADHKIRRSVSERLCGNQRSDRKSPGIFFVLQSGTDSPIPGLPDSGGGLLPEAGTTWVGGKTGHDHDWIAVRSSIPVHYRANIFHRDTVKREKMAKQFLKALKKPTAFPKPSGTKQVHFSLIMAQNGRPTIHLKKADLLS